MPDKEAPTKAAPAKAAAKRDERTYEDGLKAGRAEGRKLAKEVAVRLRFSHGKSSTRELVKAFGIDEV